MNTSKTCACGAPISESLDGTYVAFDLQREFKQIDFCSADCLKSWLHKKLIGMCIALALGLFITISMLIDGEGLFSICLFFLPYMIRQVWHTFGEIFNSGAIGECISIGIVVLSTITVIYPAYKLFQEIMHYRKIHKELPLV